MNEYENAAVIDAGSSGRAVPSAKKQFAEAEGVPFDAVVGKHIEHGYVAVMHYLDEQTAIIHGEDDYVKVRGEVDRKHFRPAYGSDEVFLQVDPIGFVIHAHRNDEFWELSIIEDDGIDTNEYVSLYDGDNVPRYTDAIEVTKYDLSFKQVER